METITVETRWVDIDSYGHMNNAKYFDLMTEARARCLLTLPSPLDVQYFLADTQCRFRIPILYPNSITIKQWVTRIDDNSFNLAYSFYTNTQKAHAEGTARMVCFNTTTNKSCQIPKSIKPHLQKHLKES